MGVIDDIGPGPVALDTPAIIYFIEDHPVFGPLVAPVFAAIAAGRLAAVVSALTLLEVLVVPYRAGRLDLAERYEALLTRSRGVTLADLDLAVLRGAAQLRAIAPQVRTPDALQLSTALRSGCRALLTNDARLPALPGLAVCRLASYLPPAATP